MGEQVRNRSFWRLVLATFALWTLFALITALQYHVNTSPKDRVAFPLSRWMELTLRDNWLKAAITIPLIIVLSGLHRRVKRWLPRIAVYVLLLFGFVGMHVILRPFVVPLVVNDEMKSGGRTVFLQLDELDYIEAAGNYARLHVGPQEFIIRETMAALESKLPQGQFVRIHRSVIVNRTRIKELRPWFTGEYVVLLTTGKELTLSRGYRDRLHLLTAPA